MTAQLLPPETARRLGLASGTRINLLILMNMVNVMDQKDGKIKFLPQKPRVSSSKVIQNQINAREKRKLLKQNRSISGENPQKYEGSELSKIGGFS
ncbi:hypothetical protein [uncultured Methanoregula sp.]|uniref:hypothetical protein n=1 Tax=uncultured Methanoregula sp. TaxID=1005933 RepID=UPI002AAB0B28|nr:hypothetical protein [uncultured Methanoregula sp.]